MFGKMHPITFDRRLRAVTHFFFLALLLLVSVVASAAEHVTSEQVMLAERPSSNGEATEIEVGVFLLDIDEIDDVRQRFSVDLFIVARWHDYRLALPEDERKGQMRFMSRENIWNPKVLIINDRGLTKHLRDGVSVDDLGTVMYKNRLSGQLSANLEFKEFPFDVQRLPIEIMSYESTSDELRFTPHPGVADLESRFSIEGWSLKELEPTLDDFIVPGDGARLPRITYTVEASRDSDYYALTMLVPMSLIIFMAWTVFWLQPHIVPPRIAISTASIFSLIALGVSIRLGLPKISYLTKADIFVLGCTLMVFLALGMAVIGSRWANSDRMEQALKANAILRWVYAVMFMVIALLAFLH